MCNLLFTCLDSVVEFKDEEFVKKAVTSMNKHDLNGRPLTIKEVGNRPDRKTFDVFTLKLYYILMIYFLECSTTPQCCGSKAKFPHFPYGTRTLMGNTQGVCCNAWVELNVEAGGRKWAAVEWTCRHRLSTIPTSNQMSSMPYRRGDWATPCL